MKRDLIRKQIIKSYQEILFIRAIFSLINCISIFFIGFIFEKTVTSSTKDEIYVNLAEVIVALLVPYITFISQGYNYPRARKINVLRYLLFKRRLNGEDLKTIYEI